MSRTAQLLIAFAVLLGILTVGAASSASSQEAKAEERAMPPYTKLASSLSSSNYETRLAATQEALRRGGVEIKEGRRTVGAPIGPRSILSLSTFQVANLALQSGTDRSTINLQQLGQQWALGGMMVKGSRNAGEVIGAYLREMVQVEKKRASANRAFIPMFLDAMAKQRAPGSNLAGNFEPSSVQINGLEEILLAISMERFLPKKRKKASKASLPASSRAFKPCTDLVETLAIAPKEWTWGEKKMVKDAVKNNVIKPGLTGAIGRLVNVGREVWKKTPGKFVKLVVGRIMSFLKVADTFIDVYKTAVLLTSTTIQAEAVEASREKPQSVSGGFAKAEYSDFIARAGVDEATMQQYLNNSSTRPFREAVSDCLKVVGLPAPFWSDSIVEDLEKFKVEWELKNPAQEHYNWDAPYTGGSGGTVWAQPPEPLIGLGQLTGYSSPSGPQAIHTAKLMIEPQEWRSGMKGQWVEAQVDPYIQAKLDTSEFKSDDLADAAFAIGTADPFGLAKSVVQAANNLLKRFYGPQSLTTMTITYREKCSFASDRATSGDGPVCALSPPEYYSGTISGHETGVVSYSAPGQVGENSHVERSWNGNVTFSYTGPCPAAGDSACYDLTQAAINYSENSTTAITEDGGTVTCTLSGSGTLREGDIEEFDKTFIGEGFDELWFDDLESIYDMFGGFTYRTPALAYATNESGDIIHPDTLAGNCRAPNIEPYSIKSTFDTYNFLWDEDPPMMDVEIVWAPGQFGQLDNWSPDLYSLERSWSIKDNNPERGETFDGDYSWSLQGGGSVPVPTSGN